MFDALKKYAVFSGRARRREYWLFILLFWILIIVAGYIDYAMGNFNTVSDTANSNGVNFNFEDTGFMIPLTYLALIIPSWSVIVRRLHDIDKSGWWSLLNFVPFIGQIVLFVWSLINGTTGENRFGPDPKAIEHN